jgi:hypothetical protein
MTLGQINIRSQKCRNKRLETRQGRRPCPLVQKNGMQHVRLDLADDSTDFAGPRSQDRRLPGLLVAFQQTVPVGQLEDGRPVDGAPPVAQAKDPMAPTHEEPEPALNVYIGCIRNETEGQRVSHGLIIARPFRLGLKAILIN